MNTLATRGVVAGLAALCQKESQESRILIASNTVGTEQVSVGGPGYASELWVISTFWGPVNVKHSSNRWNESTKGPFLLKWQRSQALYYTFSPTVTTVRVFSPFHDFSKMVPS
jgi:hypothetical protein